MCNCKVLFNMKGEKLNEEMDFVFLLKYFWKKRTYIIVSSIIGMIFGITVAIVSPVKYKASISFIPQGDKSSQGIGGIGGIAQFAGINLSALSSNEMIKPNLYPLIINSVPFQLELMNSLIIVDNDTTSLLKLYRNENIKNTEVNSESCDITNTFSEQEYEISQIIQDNVELLVNEEDNSVKIDCFFETQSIASQVCHNTFFILQKFIAEIGVKKVKQQHDFIREKYYEQKLRYDSIQNLIANYQDNNKNIRSAQFQLHLQNLRNENNVIFEIYSGLAKQFENSKINLEKHTIVFSVISPVTPSFNKSKPNRTLIIFVLSFLGFSLGVIIVLVILVVGDVKNKWNSVR